MQRGDSFWSKLPEVLSNFPKECAFLYSFVQGRIPLKQYISSKKNQEIRKFPENPTSDYVSNLAAKILKIPNTENNTHSVWGRTSICRAYYLPFCLINNNNYLNIPFIMHALVANHQLVHAKGLRRYSLSCFQNNSYRIIQKG